MVQTSVGDGLLEAQKQSLLNSSLWSRGREAGSPGAFPHFLLVSSVSLSPCPVARKKTLVKARTREQRPSTTAVVRLLGANAEVKASLMCPPYCFPPTAVHLHLDTNPLDPPGRLLQHPDHVEFFFLFL